MSNRRNNNTFAGAVLQYDTREDELAAFDALPKPLRWMLNENATKLSAVRVQKFVDNIASQAGDVTEAVLYTMRRLPEIERNEILVTAGRYRSETLQDYPFIAAGVTVQRYGPHG